NRRAKSLGGGTCAFAARQPPPEASVGARRSDHRNPKKSCGVAGPPSFERRRVLMDAVAALAPGSGLIAAACTALGLSRASLHRRQAFRRQPLAPVRRRPAPMRALVAQERQVVLNLLREPRFVDLAPAEVYACLLDQGVYLCSIRTMYRVLAEHDEVRERRRQLRRPVYQKPELLAEGPNQVWSWDITKLMGPEMELLLSLCHHRYFQPQDRRLVHRR